MRVKAVPADHAGTRYPLATESPALGYVVAGGLSAYFAGDTGLYDGMRDLAPIDVAVLPVGGWGPRLPDDHLNPLSAAKALQLLRPGRVRARALGHHLPAVAAAGLQRQVGRVAARVRPVRRAPAPDVEVRVLQPGETTTFVPRRRGAGEPAGGGEARSERAELRIALLQLRSRLRP